MLGKLIKHDFRALSRTLFPLQIGVFAAGILATLFMTLNLRLSTTALANGRAFQFAFTGISAVLMVIIAIGIMASSIVTLLLVCIHYHRNLMGDQGYLTFTLPTTAGRILWSKLITGMIWIVINLCVIGLTVLIFAVFGTASSGLVSHGALETLKGIFAGLPSLSQYANMPLVFLLLAVCAILTLAEMLLRLYFAVTVGGRSTRHRLLASIGMYIALTSGVNTVRTILMLLFTIGPIGLFELTAAADVGAWFIHSALLANGVLAAGLCVLFFFSSRAILKNKLNLQ